LLLPVLLIKSLSELLALDQGEQRYIFLQTNKNLCIHGDHPRLDTTSLYKFLGDISTINEDIALSFELMQGRDLLVSPRCMDSFSENLD
jgi:hypothetical protein